MTNEIITLETETTAEPVHVVYYGDHAQPGECRELGFVFETPCGLWAYATAGAQRHYNHRAGISKEQAAKRLARRAGLTADEMTPVIEA